MSDGSSFESGSRSELDQRSCPAEQSPRLLPSLVDEVGKTNPNGREESGVIRND